MNRRSRSRFPGLDKSVNLRIRHEVMDQDYLQKLSESEKEWLSNFMREYVSADFNHPGKILNRKKKQKKAIYDSNNSRNRDLYSLTNNIGMLKEEKEIRKVVNKVQNQNIMEDVLIELLDNFNATKPKV